ncbi:MAG: hypothetical protein C4297_07255 [Gemmataceae bacterium]
MVPAANSGHTLAPANLAAMQGPGRQAAPGSAQVMPASSAVPAASAAWPKLQQLLRQLGVEEYQMEWAGGVYRLRCFVPVPGQPGVARCYEATGSDERAVCDALVRELESSSR